MEYLGTSNGVKAGEQLDTSAAKDEASAADKPAADDSAPKEQEPDFTVTPSKEGQSAACTCQSAACTCMCIFIQVEVIRG